MTPELILAISAFVTAFFTAIISVIQSGKTAKKDEVQLLRDEVTRLQKRIEDLEQEKGEWMNKYDNMHKENVKLREQKSDLIQILRVNAINVEEDDITGRITEKIRKKNEKCDD